LLDLLLIKMRLQGKGQPGGGSSSFLLLLLLLEHTQLRLLL